MATAADRDATAWRRRPVPLRLCGWILGIALIPVVAVAVLLSFMLIGIPFFILAAPPCAAGVSVGLGRTTPKAWSKPLAIDTGLCLAVAAAGFAFVLATGLDDLDTSSEVLQTLATAVVLIAALCAGSRLLTFRSDGGSLRAT